MLEPASLSRRSFLTHGVTGTLMLVGVGSLSQLQGCAAPTARPAGYRVLRRQDQAILARIAPVVLNGALPGENPKAVDALLLQLDAFLHSTNTENHAALHQLFDLLDMRVTRLLMTGEWQAWDAMNDDTVDAVLVRWRDSRLPQLRLGYAQLTQLLSLVWYAQPGNPGKQVYPGAPTHTPAPISTVTS